jgi:hypothetical protein
MVTSGEVRHILDTGKNLFIMKIRKFNESNLGSIDPKYFDFVFDEFIDSGANSDYDLIGTEDAYWEIFIPEPKIYKNKSKEGSTLGMKCDIEEYVKNIETVLNFSKTIKSCVDRIKDDFPDTKIAIDFEVENKNGEIERFLHIIFTV